MSRNQVWSGVQKGGEGGSGRQLWPRVQVWVWVWPGYRCKTEPEIVRVQGTEGPWSDSQGRDRSGRKGNRNKEKERKGNEMERRRRGD